MPKYEQKRGNEGGKSGEEERMSSPNRLKKFEGEIESGYADVKDMLAECIQRRPLQSVLLALAGGLLLGRFKIRPIESVLLASGLGLALGMGATSLGARREASSRD